MKKNIKSGISLALKAGIAAGLIYWLIYKGVLNWQDLGALLTPQWVSLGLGLLGLNLIIVTFRWLGLMRSRGLSISYFDTYKLELIGMFFNYALPGGVGGDLVKGYYIVQDNKGRRLDAAMSVLLDRVLGLYSMTILSLLTILLNWSLIVNSEMLLSISFMVATAFVAASVGLVVGISTRIRNHRVVNGLLEKLPGHRFIFKVYDGLQSFRNDLSVVAKSIGFSLLAQSSVVMVFYTVGMALGSDLALGIYFFAVPLGMIVSALPLAPAGIGVGQVAMMALFNMYEPNSGHIGALGITAFQVGFLVWGLVGSVFYLQRGRVTLEQAEMEL